MGNIKNLSEEVKRAQEIFYKQVSNNSGTNTVMRSSRSNWITSNSNSSRWSSKSTLNSSANSNSEQINAGIENVRKSLNKGYSNIDAQGKLKGNLFSKLMNEINETINNVNTRKQNTKI